jgi:NAD(P)-dependent dehydrogenase (short-subunit alcohol dehydrogenase family)
MWHQHSYRSDLLTNRVILVTGASSGIGRAVAKTYAAHGATVILLARTIRNLENVYDEIEQAGFPQPAIYPMNLSNATPEDYENLKDTIAKNFGRLDGLLHNAGMLGRLTSIEHTRIEDWYQVLQVNLNSRFLLTRATLPLLKQGKDASIIFTQSDIGRKAKAYWGGYAVSQFGCEALMQILADELETNTSIRVNSLNPGKIKTRFRNEAYPAEDPKFLKSPDDILPLYLYLMGPDSQGITGQSF